MNASYAVVALYQPPGTSRPFQSTNWQGQQNSQIDQLQRRVTRLENDLRWYQSPWHSANRSYDRSYIGWNDEYNDEYLSPPFQNQRSMLEAPPTFDQGTA